MYTVLGHVHTGTSCIAKCLINAGVDFGDNCNGRYEDRNLIKLSNQHVRYADSLSVSRPGEFAASFSDIVGPVKAFKHPFTPVFWDLIPSYKAIITLRSPQSWLMTMDGPDAFNDDDWFNSAGQEWNNIYSLVYEIWKEEKCPIVLYGSENCEEQISSAFDQLGLKYNGGYDSSRVHNEHRADYIPDCTKNTWDKLEQSWRS